LRFDGAGKPIPIRRKTMKTRVTVTGILPLVVLFAVLALVGVSCTGGYTGAGNGDGGDPAAPPGGGTAATVTGVTVSPSTASVAKGGTQAFTATVFGTNSPAQTVTWSVSGGAGTTISAGGILTVAAGENAAILTVRAISAVDATKSGAAAVTVTAGAATVTAVTAVTVSPDTASVVKGATATFTATVTGFNSPAQTVTWTVSGGGAGTTISAGGILSVAAGESAATLTVRATSAVDTAKSGTATVTVTGGGGAGALVGTWQSREVIYGTVGIINLVFTSTTITFSFYVESGQMPEGYPGPQTYPYTATATTITIDVMTFEYRISGNTLYLTTDSIAAIDNDSVGEPITLTRVEAPPDPPFAVATRHQGRGEFGLAF
jgi:hypothetical protein